MFTDWDYLRRKIILSPSAFNLPTDLSDTFQVETRVEHLHTTSSLDWPYFNYYISPSEDRARYFGASFQSEGNSPLLITKKNEQISQEKIITSLETTPGGRRLP